MYIIYTYVLCMAPKPPPPPFSIGYVCMYVCMYVWMDVCMYTYAVVSSTWHIDPSTLEPWRGTERGLAYTSVPKPSQCSRNINTSSHISYIYTYTNIYIYIYILPLPARVRCCHLAVVPAAGRESTATPAKACNNDSITIDHTRLVSRYAHSGGWGRSPWGS
jgi:hypothetical protein